jgi:hypothetical protein
MPSPGFAFAQILSPRGVWLPNASSGPVQTLCLGSSLPASIPLVEVILLTYGALTMMTVQMNPADAAGLLNPAAAAFFQANNSLIPLSREPFILKNA